MRRASTAAKRFHAAPSSSMAGSAAITSSGGSHFLRSGSSSRCARDGWNLRSCTTTSQRVPGYSPVCRRIGQSIRPQQLASCAVSIMRRHTGLTLRSHRRGSLSGGCSSSVIHACSRASANRSCAVGRSASRRSICRYTSSLRVSAVLPGLRFRAMAALRRDYLETLAELGRPIHLKMAIAGHQFVKAD